MYTLNQTSIAELEHEARIPPWDKPNAVDTNIRGIDDVIVKDMQKLSELLFDGVDIQFDAARKGAVSISPTSRS